MDQPMSLEEKIQRGQADAGSYFRYMLEFVGFTREDGRTIRQAALVIEKHIPSIVADFYANLLRYPPTTACPWCASPDASWAPVEGRGTLHSYGEVHHAIQSAFRSHTPYMLVLVELDTQSGQPTAHEALRITGNLAAADGELAPPDLVARVGIGSRLRILFKDAGNDIAIPLWTLDESAQQPASPWRYPDP